MQKILIKFNSTNDEKKKKQLLEEENFLNLIKSI